MICSVRFTCSANQVSGKGKVLVNGGLLAALVCCQIKTRRRIFVPSLIYTWKGLVA